MHTLPLNHSQISLLIHRLQELAEACKRLSSCTAWVEELHQLRAERQDAAQQAGLAKRLTQAEKEMRKAEVRWGRGVAPLGPRHSDLVLLACTVCHGKN